MEEKNHLEEAIELSENYYGQYIEEMKENPRQEKEAKKNSQVCCRFEENTCLNNLISSIALVETSLSHILNAEGEKLQKAVEKSSSVSDLLKINDSVNQTLVNANFLEQTLYLKLESITRLEAERRKK